MSDLFESELAPRPEDQALLERAIAGALERAPLAIPVRRRRWPLILVAAALLVGAAAAARLVRTAPPAPVTTAATAPEPTAAAAVVAPTPAPEPGPEPEPASSVEPPGKPAPSAVPAAPSAADLFARANAARRAKRDAEAVRLYRELQQRYPDSREARASRVTLGQLLLDRTDAKEALGEFDGYLSKSGGPVSEEALVGRARALDKLGKRAEARAAWQELLKRYPGSVHAAEARTRLGAL